MHDVEQQQTAVSRMGKFNQWDGSQLMVWILIGGECRSEQMGRSGPARGGDTSPADQGGAFSP